MGLICMLKTALLGSTMLVALSMNSAAMAQTADQTAAQSTTGKTQAQATQTEVVVTGSRIPRANLEQPTPVSVVSNEIIRTAGTPNLGDILSQTPALAFTGTVRANSNNYGNGAGLALVDLRGLGPQRSLVLVDGLRHVAGDIGSNAVDLNSIPAALVDRVEVITGGASALYGSDAVTGVVNVILKRNFTGVQAEAQAGGYDGFGAKYSASASVGHDFLNNRLNLVGSVFYSKEEGIRAADIPNAHNYGTIVNAADVPGGSGNYYYNAGTATPHDGKPDTIWVPNVGSDYVTRNGVLIDPNTFLPAYAFDASGKLIPVPVRTGYNSFAFGQLPANCADCYFPETYTQLSSPVETKGLNLRGRYEVNTHLSAHLDAKFVQSDVSNVIQPSFSFADYQLQPDNAFIQPDLRAALAGTAPGDYPLIGKFLNDARSQDIIRRTGRIVAGLDGDFDTGFALVNWNGALNYGRNQASITNTSLMITANFQAALDSVIDPKTGQPACRINVPSKQPAGYTAPAVTNAAACAPYNPFGTLASPASLAYAFGTFGTHDALTQTDAVLNASTDTSRFFKLPGGPLRLAAGVEYRMERTHERNDPALVNGSTENLASNSGGGYNVYEGYVEGELPIFRRNGLWREELTLDAAYRGAQYSYAKVGYADAYKFGAVYSPIADIKFRGTYSRAIRAPNITEAFTPAQSTYFNITDPCDVNNITTNANYAKNCAAAGVPAGFHANTNASIIGQTSGNANLDAEKSISYTGGFVLQPRWVPHLAITVDYYAIKIKNAITLVSAQDIINNCYSNAAGLDPQYCSLLTRGANHNINFVSNTYVNAAKLETDGLDITATYSMPASWITRYTDFTRRFDGQLSWSLSANYVYRFHSFPFQNNTAQFHLVEGTTSVPHLKGLASVTYRQGPAEVSWKVRYLGRSATFNRDFSSTSLSEATDQPFAPARFYHSIIGSYKLGGRFQGAEIYGGVNDIFGELPPFYTIGTGASLGGTQDGGYELGRYAFVGMRFRR